MLNSQSVRQHALDFLSKMETEIINELQKNDIVILPLIDCEEKVYAFVESCDDDYCYVGEIVESKVVAVAVQNNRLLILCQEWVNGETHIPTLTKTSDNKEVSEHFGLYEDTFAPLTTMVDVYTTVAEALSKLNKKG